MRHRNAVSVLTLTTAVVALALFAGPAAARTAPTGSFTLHPGQTLHATGMTLPAKNDYYYYEVGYTIVGGGDTFWANNEGSTSPVTLADETVSNPADASDIAVTLYLYSYWSGGFSWPMPLGYYWSIGSSATQTNLTDVNHVTTGWVKGKAVVSMNGVGTTGSMMDSSYRPALGQGDFNATVTISKR